MQQLELFEYRRNCLFDSKNQIAHYFDILKETKDTISYSEHIEPNSGFAIAGMSYEEYVDINKDELNGLTYDQILKFLNNFLYFSSRSSFLKLLRNLSIWS